MSANLTKDKKINRVELRKFGITMGAILSLLGAIFLWRGRGCYFYLFILSMSFLFFGAVLPSLLKPIYKIWMTLGILMGWVMTRIILCTLFYLVVTPISLLLKLFGKDSLGLKFKRNHIDTYWIPKENKRFVKSDYERQF